MCTVMKSSLLEISARAAVSLMSFLSMRRCLYALSSSAMQLIRCVGSILIRSGHKKISKAFLYFRFHVVMYRMRQVMSSLPISVTCLQKARQTKRSFMRRWSFSMNPCVFVRRCAERSILTFNRTKHTIFMKKLKRCI